MLLCLLSKAFPLCKINMDLTDCDKVLRVEGETIETLRIISLVNKSGFMCEVLA